MEAGQAASHLIQNIKESAHPVLRKGGDALVPIILDGENAWEYYHRSGREFLRRFYDALAKDGGIEAVTVSEAIARHKNPPILRSLVPGSWINANFNVWIGAPEDNRSWDYLHQARNFFAQAAGASSEEQRRMAEEELFIAEGSDWNWWYGPEHHSANDREFDELYRKHLSNIYQLLGATPPDYLAQPIMRGAVQPIFTPQSYYIHPRIDGEIVRYFEWMGAAHYSADRSSGAMHGKVYLLDSIYAGIDQENVYGRMDFLNQPEGDFYVVVNVESWAESSARAQRALRLEVDVRQGKIAHLRLSDNGDTVADGGVMAALARTFEFRLPLALFNAAPRPSSAPPSPAAQQIRLRFSVWQNRLPIDALPVEEWMELPLLAEEEMVSLAQ